MWSFVSLNISLSHWRSFEMRPSSRAYVCKSLLEFTCNYVSRTISETFSVKWRGDLKISLAVTEIDAIYNFLLVCFIFALHSNYDCILYHFWYKARLAEIMIFEAMIRGGGVHGELLFGIDKLEWCGYLMVPKSLTMFNHFDRIPHVMDRQDCRAS